jgi:hypothetical protein
LENALGLALPPSYRAFLLSVGALAIQDRTVSGIVGNNPLAGEGGSLFGDTQAFRGEFALPRHFLVIQPDSDAPYCFDSSNGSPSGEMPVVCYQLNTRTATQVASSFPEWLRRFFFHEAA